MTLRALAPLALIAPLALAACQQPAPGAAPAAATNSAAPVPSPAQDHAQNPSQAAYAAANARMHAGMGSIDADPDVAFAQGMIAHHQGAIEMSDVLLKHGRDPELRKLAETIKAAQGGEIRQMQDWLKRGGHPVSAGTGGAVDHGAMGH